MNMKMHPTIEEFRNFLAGCNGEPHHVLWLDESGEVYLTGLPDNMVPVAWDSAGADHIRFALGIFVRVVGACELQSVQNEEWVRRLYQDLTRFWTLHQQARQGVPRRIDGSRIDAG